MKLFGSTLTKTASRENIVKIRLAITIFFCAVTIVCFSFVTTAENTYIISDGNQTLVFETFSADTESVLLEAGISLNYGDTYTSEIGSNGVEVSITRGQNIMVCYGDTTSVVVTPGETVGSLLANLEITYDDDDLINYDLQDKTFDGMVVMVTPVEVTYTEVEVTINYSTLYVANASMYVGSKKTTTEGVNGLTIVTYQSISVDGVIQEFDIFSEEDVTEPVDEVIEYGTKQKPTASSSTSHSSSSSSSSSSIVVSGGGTLTLPNGETLTYTKSLSMRATAYTTERQTNKITATGAIAQVGIVAVDPKVIPLGTKLYIVSASGSWVYGYAVAGDTGVSGRTIDLFYNTYDECINFGVRNATVYVLD